MNSNILDHYKKKIQSLLDKKLIRPSRFRWSCATFYDKKITEIERDVPRLVINYKPLNIALKWIRYLIPNKKDLLSRIAEAKVFSKLDLKSEFW